MPTQPYIIDGKRVPSVTTILGKFKDPGPLMHWSWRTANDVLIEALDVIQNRKDTAGWLATDPLERANFRSESKKATDAGSITHDVIERWIDMPKVSRKNFLDNVNLRYLLFEYQQNRDISISALNGITAFRSWIAQTRFELIETEVPLLSRKFKYGGTLDAIGVFESQELVLFDWKTSAAIYPEYLCQIAAYKQLWEENFPDRPIQGCHLLRFDKKTADSTHKRLTNLDDAWALFATYRLAYDLLQLVQDQTK